MFTADVDEFNRQNTLEWHRRVAAFQKEHGRQPQPGEVAHPTDIGRLPGIAPATRSAMRTKSVGSGLVAPTGSQELSEADAIRIVNEAITEAAEDGTLPELQAAIAAHFGLTDRKDIARLWRNLGADLGETERALARREEERQLDSVQVVARYGTQIAFISPKKSKKSNRPPAHWER